MKTKKRAQKARVAIMKNLTYIRLKTDVAVIEQEMEDNQPVQKENGKNIFQRVISSITTEVANNIRRQATQDLSGEKKIALENLQNFEKAIDLKELALSSDLNKFKAYVKKELFPKDKYNLQKNQFALSLILTDKNAYLRADDSLRVISDILFDDETYMQELYAKFSDNFFKIQKIDNPEKKLIIPVFSLSSFLFGPFDALFHSGIMGIASLIRYSKNKKIMKEELSNLKPSELQAGLALKLTQIEVSRSIMPKTDWKNLIDDLLRYVSNFRSDAEYEWLIENLDANANMEKIEVLNLTIKRLSRIVGI